MEYFGLLKKYPVNRPLTEWEIAHHLPQNRPSGVPPWSQFSVVRMNSTYLECVDKFFEGRGILAWWGLFVVSLLAWFLIAISILTVGNWMQGKDMQGNLFALLFVYSMSVPLIIFFWHIILRKEVFRLTHYPMRFNRKNRMVYVTRLDGTVMAEPWDRLYFTVGHCGEDARDIQGHRLADDGVTVLETFSLAFYDTEDSPHLLTHWEFVRQYMEHGPAGLMDLLPAVLEVAGRREPFLDGFARLHTTTKIRGGFVMAVLALPVDFIYAIGRWIASITSKIPRWPEEVEQACRIDPDDPYLRDSDNVATNEAFLDAKEAYEEAVGRRSE